MVKLTEAVVRLQEMQVAKITRSNEILLFTIGPGGLESEMTKEYFALKQAEALKQIKEHMAAKEAKNKSDLNLPVEVAENAED